MTVTMSQPGPCQQKLRIQVAPDAVTPKRENVLREFQREANIAGFRKGKAPRELVERKYAQQIEEELARRLSRESLEQAATEHKLRPVGPFQIQQLELTADKGLSLEADVEVEPEFKLGEYRGIPLSKPAVVVPVEETDRAMQQLRESMAELVPAGEGQPKEKRLPELDDEFAKDMGFDALPKLREHVEAKLREHKLAEQAKQLEQELCDRLLERHTFDVPPKLVENQTERLSRDFQMRLLMAEIPEEQAKEQLEKFGEQLRTNAARHVKLGFILERIAEQEQLSLTQDEVVDRLWKLAKRYGKDPAEMRRLLDAQGLWPSVLSSLRQEKTLQHLRSLAQIDEPGEAKTEPKK